ncbi:MAG: hypothetical protein K2F58_02465, partial [Muribaculaceae bacterium]|nr:hypothetical protein [Muribaculaceae bacterium]
MESSFSFRFIKLDAALVFLLFSAILPGTGRYLFVALGGAFLMTAFASLGNSNYRGYPTKSSYKIARYYPIGREGLASILLIVRGMQ